jgi:hypothetical protein
VARTGTGLGPRRAGAAQQQEEWLAAVLQEAHARRRLRRVGAGGLALLVVACSTREGRKQVGCTGEGRRLRRVWSRDMHSSRHSRGG